MQAGQAGRISGGHAQGAPLAPRGPLHEHGGHGDGTRDVEILEMEPDYVLVTAASTDPAAPPGGALVVWTIVSSDSDGSTATSQEVVRYEYDWDGRNLFRSTSMGWVG